MGKRRRDKDDIEENSESERGSTDQNEQDGLDTSQRSQQPDHSPRDIQIPLRESIQRDQISHDSSLKQAEPNQDIETRSYDEVTVTTATPPSRETIKSDVTQLAHPSTEIERGESELTISILAGGIRETITQRVTEQAKPESQMEVNETPRIAVSRPPDVQKVKKKQPERVN